MLTGGQLSSLSTARGAASPTACDFDPNNSLNLEPSEGLDSAESLNMLPPPQPDRSAPATARATPIPHALPAVTGGIISLSRNIAIYPRQSSRSCIKVLARVRCARAGYSSAIPANPRRSRGGWQYLETRLAAEILVQQAEQQMILPDAVDAKIAPRQPFAAEAAFLQHPDRGRVGGNTGGLDAVQVEFAEQRWQQHPQRRGHVAAVGMRLPDPVSDGAGLHDAAAHIGERDAADHRAVGFPEHDERIGTVGGDVLGVAAQPPPEARPGQVVGGPDRLPGRQVFAAVFAQMRPFQEIRHLRGA